MNSSSAWWPKTRPGARRDSRRTEDARLRYLRANGLALDAQSPQKPEPAKRWAAFLSNHREAIAAMDFFTVPTLTFGVFYCFFVISHDRRRILHFNVTRHPTSAWVVAAIARGVSLRLRCQVSDSSIALRISTRT